jgi:diguanylate cyclase (GGDEF)-like protein
MRPQLEHDDVYRALVAALAASLVPTTIMTATIFGVGLFAYAATGSSLIGAATTMGAIASAAKILVLIAHTRRNARGTVDVQETRRWEVRHGLITLGMATSVGALASLIFVVADLSIQTLATGLVFGYCSGIVSRVSLRPRIAAAALTATSLPIIVAAAWTGDAPHRIMALMFGMFYLGALDSAAFTYRAAAGQICQRLDMATLARRDPLTGLFNRLGLREAFRLLPGADRTLATAVHCLDLDGFKAVNDHLGHAAGDTLLRALAARLGRCLTDADVAARIGGDEFVVVQSNVRQQGDAHALARHIARAIGEPFDVGGDVAMVGVSLGYAIRTAASAELDEMLAAADAACYRVKRQGGGIGADRSDDAGGGVAFPEVAVPARAHLLEGADATTAAR